MRDIKDVNLAVDLKIIARHYVPQTIMRAIKDVNSSVNPEVIDLYYVL